MASVNIRIDFGDPSGSLEEMGCEGMTSAQEVLDALKEDGASVAKALESWDLLDFGTVTVEFIPDIPADLQVQSIWIHPTKPPKMTLELQMKHVLLSAWVDEHRTTATWSD